MYFSFLCCFFIYQLRLLHCVESIGRTQILEELYCGEENCYHILGLSTNATDVLIRKTYRKLSLKYHPDRNTSKDALDIFRKISKAHEVLSKKEKRSGYDFYLKNPDSLWALYYGLRANYASPTNPFFVLILSILFISAIQYVNGRCNNHRIRQMIQESPRFKKSLDNEIQLKYGSRFRKLHPSERQHISDTISGSLLNEIEYNGIKMDSLLFIYRFITWGMVEKPIDKNLNGENKISSIFEKPLKCRNSVK
ncbi:uncharacterized protein LOC128884209 isoform X6 [Hylaeus volcanicus]|uniref:uncharacterized protein LOC128884209 isoform X6 n=1 Tax=Hylaeus volcanicus TaxID=313075 RepID=UPI0023B7CB6D|nr:uncharacterized protein LOC128884209 isoform X6 [Hylaeus volcanicus]